MKKIYLLLIVFLSACALQAQTVYYVNGATGSDANDGSQSSPWATLNPTGWAIAGNNCIVNIAPGEYFINDRINIDANVQLIGTSKDEVSLMGENDEDFWDDSRGELPFTNGAFRIAGNATLTLKNITLKNQRRIDEWGGSIRIKWLGTLNLENVDFLNSICNAGGGGAIDSEGTLNLTNVLFKGCKAPECAVINLATSKEKGSDGIIRGTFEKVRFIENESNGCIINLEASDEVDAIFNNCSFENNKVANYGPVLRLISWYAGVNFKTKISNSAFIENIGENGGCIAMHTDPDVQRSIDFSVTNCSFLRNKMAGAIGSVFTINGQSNDKMTGNMIFANNTIVDNGNVIPGNESIAIVITDQPVTMAFVNNIAYSSIPGTSSIVFWDEDRRTVVASNNFVDFVGGAQMDAFRDPLKNTLLEGYENPNEVLKLKTEPTYPSNGNAPYLELQAGSIAIDNGINSLAIGGKEIVLPTDIRGVAIYNGTKDAGSYEYNGATSISNPSLDEEVRAYPNPFNDVIFLNNEVAKVDIYNITGALCVSTTQTANINTSSLLSGIYFVRITSLQGKTYSLKMIK